MENASKALIIAGGMLIGIIILALFAYEMKEISETGQVYQEEMEESVVTEFNAQFEKYTGKDLNAQDVITIFDYVKEWNLNNDWAYVTITTENNDLKKLIESDYNDLIEGKSSYDIETFLTTYQDSTFTLSITKYNENNNSRVSEIKIMLK